jgi:hypothetical protein
MPHLVQVKSPSPPAQVVHSASPFLPMPGTPLYSAPAAAAIGLTRPREAGPRTARR